MSNHRTIIYQEVTVKINNLLTVVILLSSITLFAGSEWKTAKQGEGILVLNKPVAGSPMKELKAECILNAPLEVVWEVLYDNSRWKLWFADCIEQTVLKMVSPSKKVVYHVVDVPWPISDRDTVAVCDYNKDFAKGTITVSVRNISAPDVEQYNMEKTTKDNNRVRMPKMFAIFTATRQGPDKTKFIYNAHAEPGVALPAWVLNMFATAQPFNTLKKLQSEVSKDLYKKRAGL